MSTLKRLCFEALRADCHRSTHLLHFERIPAIGSAPPPLSGDFLTGAVESYGQASPSEGSIAVWSDYGQKVLNAANFNTQ